MSTTIETASRRRFVKAAGMSVALLPIVSLALRQSAHGQAMPKLDNSDPQAKALQYVHQSPKADQTCKNCQLYKGDASAEWGPCQIFQGKEVSAKGWCQAWVAKPAG